MILAALCLPGQPTRDGYRTLYRTWREADPNLELDAADAPAGALASRAGKAAPLAAAYSTAHTATLRATAQQQEQNLQWLNANVVQAQPDLAPAPEEIRFANRESAIVASSASTFANDPDRVIQQLRQAYQREQASLDALKASIVSRQQAEEKSVTAAGAAEQARGTALQQYTFLTSTLSQAGDAMNQEASAWAAYYAKLADAAQAPLSTAAPSPPASADAAPRAPSITPVPLARYVGVWSYRPGPGAQYFGSEPEVVDFTVHESGGHATGTFYARFKLGPGAGDPVLRFEFSGDFKPTLKQSFKLTTAEGASGTMDLTPGVAFNELEVSFSTDARTGKVNQGDMILLKQ